MFLGQAVEERSCSVEEEFCNLLQERISWFEIINRRGKECETEIDHLPDSIIQIDYRISFSDCNNLTDDIFASYDFRSRCDVAFLKERGIVVGVFTDNSMHD